jgi:DNA topoisomerase-1
MKLLIVESPSKAKTINKYLGSEYKVVASVGHVRDLPKSNKKAIDIPAGFVPHYEISKGKEGVVSEIRELAHEAKEVLLATDPDREGEAISWHLVEAAKLAKGKTKRVTFHEITKEAILEALTHPRDIDQNLRKAQEARRVLDRLVGYDLSGLIWKKVRYGLSAGRVQSPALRILCEREREITAFIPENYFVLEFDALTPQKTPVTFTAAQILNSAEQADTILTKIRKATITVGSVTETPTTRSARAPFTTSTLQQTASTRLGFSPKRTMIAAQKLYEAGLITYMRTDSTTLSAQALTSIKAVVTKEYGAALSESRQFQTKSKNAQEAHEAIRPTDPKKLRAGITDDQKAVYELIWRRTIASQMIDASLIRTKIIPAFSDTEIPEFAVTGSRVTSPGWLLADPESTGEERTMPQVSVGDTLSLVEARRLDKQTEPPARFTEAGLIKELEKRGIGRPSTYASIISTIEERGYVEKLGRSLKPTDLGDVVSKFLETNFTTYISDDFTAEMENKLDEIASGEREYEKTLKDFYVPFSKEVKEKDKSTDKLTTLGEADAKFKCPKCDSSMDIKLSRTGKFLSCSKYPDCDGALTMEGTELVRQEDQTPLGIDPVTGLPILVLVGRFGPYVQLGHKEKGKKTKPRMASIPKEIDPSKITLAEALKLLSLPRVLGTHPTTGKEISTAIGRFGPFVVHDGDFRNLKVDSPYTITLERALEILAEEKKRRGFQKKKK